MLVDRLIYESNLAFSEVQIFWTPIYTPSQYRLAMSGSAENWSTAGHVVPGPAGRLIGTQYGSRASYLFLTDTKSTRPDMVLSVDQRRMFLSSGDIR